MRLAARRSKMAALRDQTEEILSLIAGCAYDLTFAEEIEDFVDMMIYFANKCRQMSHVDLEKFNEDDEVNVADEELTYTFRTTGFNATVLEVWIKLPQWCERHAACFASALIPYIANSFTVISLHLTFFLSPLSIPDTALAIALISHAILAIGFEIAEGLYDA